jgi:hypothetical protein
VAFGPFHDERARAWRQPAREHRRRRNFAVWVPVTLAVIGLYFKR